MGKGIVDKLKEEFDIEDEWLPLEIHPETPETGVSLKERFPEASMRQMHINLRRMGRLYGIDFNPSERLPNSHKLLAAGEYAKEKGKFHEFHEKAFHAYFTEGLDIGEEDIIRDTAGEAGLNKEELLNRLREAAYDNILQQVQEEAHQYGISSTPTFIIDGKYAVVGAQPMEAFREALISIEKEQ
ncbi:MAG: DsbA family protein [Bacillota bacterium]|nr:DsbA family protein [Bacillota bacterium]